MNTQPLVSVIIPVYNADKYLKDSLQSIIYNTYKNLEVICINDGSSDKSLKILNDVASTDKRIKIINQKNKGIVSALNIGIQAANGKYIARMDADDIAVSDRIEYQINLLVKNNADITFGSIQYIGFKQGYHYVDEENSEIITGLLLGNRIPHPTMLCKAEILRKYKYDFRFEFAEDYELWVRLAMNNYKFIGTKKILLQYRVHEEQISSRKKITQDNIKITIKQSIRKWLNIFDIHENDSLLKDFYKLLIATNSLIDRGFTITEKSYHNILSASINYPNKTSQKILWSLLQRLVWINLYFIILNRKAN